MSESTTKHHRSFMIENSNKQSTGCTCSRQLNAASRYFCAFFVQAEDIRFNIAFGASGFEADILLWQDVQTADNAYNTASFPCHIVT